MRDLLLTGLSCSVLLLVVGCGATSEEVAPSARADGTTATTDAPAASPSHAAPTLSTLRRGDVTHVTVTFRGEDASPISEERPLVLVVDGSRVEAPLVSGPARFSEEGGAQVSQAAYELPGGMRGKLLRTPPDDVTVRVHDGNTYRSYPYVSGDLIE